MPDSTPRDIRDAVRDDLADVAASTEAEARAIITAKDSAGAFQYDFVRHCALLTQEELWDIRVILHQSFPKDGFGTRGEWTRRIRKYQDELAPDPDKPAGWTGDLILNADGRPKALLANAIAALRLAPEFSGVLAFDDFAKRLRLRQATPWGREQCEWSDNDGTRLAEWLQHQGILVGVETAEQAAMAVAYEHKFHPVREYLEGLEAGPESLLSTWLIDFLGAKPDNAEQESYISAIGRRWLISAVARIFRPGCKADCCLTIEGKTGLGKSTALAILGGEWFSDTVGVLGNKDFQMNIQGVWILEIGDLAGYHKSEIEQVKTTFSSSVDRFRWSYGRNPADYPRQCVFACTTERDDWSKESSARRFWPFASTFVDADGLRQARHQIWAEAVAAFRAGEPWYLDTDDLRARSETEQAKRWDPHPWYRKIEDFIDGLDMTSTEDILSNCIKMDLEKQNRRAQLDVAECMRSMGWAKKTARDPALGMQPKQRWVRTEPRQ